MTTLDIYTSKMYRVRVKVRHGRKHGMPRGRGRVMWRLSPNRITLSAETREAIELGGMVLDRTAALLDREHRP